MVIFQDCSLCLLYPIGLKEGVVWIRHTSTLSPDVFRGPCVLGTTTGNEVSEEKYSKGEGERRNEFFSDFFRWCPTIFLAYTSIYSTDIEPTTRFYSNPPPYLLPLCTEPEICFKQMCVNVSLSTWLLSYKNSILALSHILPTMQQPFSLQNEKN